MNKIQNNHTKTRNTQNQQKENIFMRELLQHEIFRLKNVTQLNDKFYERNSLDLYN